MDLLYYLMIYYQCDIASYTEDAGGIKFLEHLFTYQNGAKVFGFDPFYSKTEIENLEFEFGENHNILDGVIIHTDHKEYSNLDFEGFKNLKFIFDGRNQISYLKNGQNKFEYLSF